MQQTTGVGAQESTGVNPHFPITRRREDTAKIEEAVLTVEKPGTRTGIIFKRQILLESWAAVSNRQLFYVGT